jgi:hypothetical protein
MNDLLIHLNLVSIAQATSYLRLSAHQTMFLNLTKVISDWFDSAESFLTI